MLPYGNTNGTIIGNFDTRHYYLGKTLGVSDSSIHRYGEDLPVVKIEPLASVLPNNPEARNLVITSRSGSLILANDYDSTEKDQMLQVNSTRVRHRGSILSNGDPQANVKRSEIYFDSTNFYSAGETVSNPATEQDEFTNIDHTWRSRRNINYLSPERLRFRKFAECVNYQSPGDTSLPEYPDQSYAGPNLDIDINRGTIHHRILIANVNSIDITDLEWADPDIGRSGLQHIDHLVEPGTSITVILYHKDDLRTIAWPGNFMFLGGDRDLTTEPDPQPAQIINGVTVSNIQAIDMLHAFYDGNNWWCSITRGYA